MPKLHIHVVNETTLKLLEQAKSSPEAARRAALELMSSTATLFSNLAPAQHEGNTLITFINPEAPGDASKSVTVIKSPEGKLNLAWAANTRCIVLRHNDPTKDEKPGLWVSHIFGGKETDFKTAGDDNWALNMQQNALVKLLAGEQGLVSAKDLREYLGALGAECEKRFEQTQQNLPFKVSKPFYAEPEVLSEIIDNPHSAFKIADQYSFPVIPMVFRTSEGEIRISFEDRSPDKQKFSKCRVGYIINKDGNINITSGEEADFFVLSDKGGNIQLLHIKSNGLNAEPTLEAYGEASDLRFGLDVMDCATMCHHFVDPALQEAKRLVGASKAAEPAQGASR